MKLRDYLKENELNIDKSQFLKKLGSPEKDIRKIISPLKKIKSKAIMELLKWFDPVFKQSQEYERIVRDQSRSLADARNAYEAMLTNLSFVNSEIMMRAKDFQRWEEVKKVSRVLLTYYHDYKKEVDYLRRIT